MAWTKLKFGRYKGKTLPQVVFSDPDWFFWVYAEGRLWGRSGTEGEDIYRKATHIKIPQKGSEELVAEYGIHPPTKKFGDLEIVPESRPPHAGSTPTFRLEVIDLSVPRSIAPYDKLGCKMLLRQVKFHLFGDTGYKMTKKRCEDFFSDASNFDI